MPSFAGPSFAGPSFAGPVNNNRMPPNFNVNANFE
jgi:hypothetical protein